MSNTVHDLTQGRFRTPEYVAAMFEKSVQWVYNNSLPAKSLDKGDGEIMVLRRPGFLYPAARRFNARTLLFDREELERIIAAAKGS